jgi:Arc/MetJ family transcription regulator
MIYPEDSEEHMRTNVVLDDELIDEAKRLTGIKSKRALIDEALRVLIQTRRRKSLLDLQGKIQFAEGYDYKRLRQDET